MSTLLGNRLALGTAQFGMPYGITNKTGQPAIDEIAKILNLARSHGIDTVDTAIAYGDSERILGEVGIEDFQVVTKLPKIPSDTNIETWMREQVESSLARLKIKQLHGLLLHKPQQLNTDLGEEIIVNLAVLKQEKLVKKTGISVYSPEELNKVFTRFIPDIIQLPLNLIDRRFISWFDSLTTHQVEIHSRSVFLQGVLLMSYQEVTAKFPGWHDLWNRWFRWLEDTQIPATSACLEFALKFSQIHRVIVGVDLAHHLTELLEILLHSSEIREFPMIATDDVQLINPSLWSLK